ncbi:hypothetical protein HG535_0F05760 [Zygotorulaspora mrakii]|uniref:Shugoshin C-terminal domain-containing protein n=1 Tax=Zygotorulaspora mrakii TaxID=42260 RepID=A0A7H9B6W6_ZYGMR|nr:uncharacterized protein HG535_0F05760 [Zygotorulaspora mrakii]QLG74064.1 hypothetical protein HG535_0F05760 [Zygotorulaspora mrakii]
MARASRRYAKTNGRRAKDAAENTTAERTTPQIQELQNIMDLERSKIEKMKSAYISQNCQLARANSSLMMKFSDLEARISDLVQENVALRSNKSKIELDYRKRLKNQLQVLEEGISHRFEEIFHMFERIREKEKLSQTSDSSHLTDSTSVLATQIAKRRSSTIGSRTSNHIHFAEVQNGGHFINTDNREYAGSDHDAEADDNPVSRLKRKRRKSSRRESIIIPTSFNFYDETGSDIENPNHKPLSANSMTEKSQIPAEEQIRPEENSLRSSDNGPQVLAQEETQNCDAMATFQTGTVERHVTDENGEKQDPMSAELHEDGSFNFTNSIIEYSIPEEVINSNANNEVDPPSSSKIEVFRDNEDIELLLDKKSLSCETPDKKNGNKVIPINNENSETNKVTFIPMSKQNKVKHSMRLPNSRSEKKIIDEGMPGTGSQGIDLRSRRTRGKAVNYALPSLRAKMRRPTEKLVDATTFTNIHDLQVSKRSKRSESDNDVVRSESVETYSEFLPKAPTNSPNLSNMRPEVPAESMKPGQDLGKENLTTVAYKKISNTALNPILRDITNQPNPKPLKTKKLYKNAIINDSLDKDEIAALEQSGDRTSKGAQSLEEGLSVFDLIGCNSFKAAHKTYRAKVKKTNIYK